MHNLTSHTGNGTNTSLSGYGSEECMALQEENPVVATFIYGFLTFLSILVLVPLIYASLKRPVLIKFPVNYAYLGMIWGVISQIFLFAQLFVQYTPTRHSLMVCQIFGIGLIYNGIMALTALSVYFDAVYRLVFKSEKTTSKDLEKECRKKFIVCSVFVHILVFMPFVFTASTPNECGNFELAYGPKGYICSIYNPWTLVIVYYVPAVSYSASMLYKAVRLLRKIRSIGEKARVGSTTSVEKKNGEEEEPKKKGMKRQGSTRKRGTVAGSSSGGGMKKSFLIRLGGFVLFFSLANIGSSVTRIKEAVNWTEYSNYTNKIPITMFAIPVFALVEGLVIMSMKKFQQFYMEKFPRIYCFVIRAHTCVLLLGAYLCCQRREYKANLYNAVKVGPELMTPGHKQGTTIANLNAASSAVTSSYYDENKAEKEKAAKEKAAKEKAAKEKAAALSSAKNETPGSGKKSDNKRKKSILI